MMTPLTRRTVLRRMAAAGVAAAFPAIAGCGAGANDHARAKGGGQAGVGTVTLGSNQSDPIPKQALAEVLGQFERDAGATVKTNTVDSDTFQEQINSYLQ